MCRPFFGLIVNESGTTASPHPLLRHTFANHAGKLLLSTRLWIRHEKWPIQRLAGLRSQAIPFVNTLHLHRLEISSFTRSETGLV